MECNSLDFVAAISRNRPDTAETIIDVMERQLSGRGGIQDVLLPRFMRESDRASTSGSRSGSASGSQRASTSENAEDKKDAAGSELESKLIGMNTGVGSQTPVWLCDK